MGTGKGGERGMGVVKERRARGAAPPTKLIAPPPRKIEIQLLRGITYVFLIKLFRCLLEQYLSNFPHRIYFTITA